MSTTQVRDDQTVNAQTSLPVLSLLGLLVILVKGRRALGAWFLLWLIVGVTLCVVKKPVYTAKTSFYPPQQSSSASSMLSQLSGLGALAGLSSGGGGLLKSPSDLYVGLLSSETLLDAMVKRFGLMEEYHTQRASLSRIALAGRTKIDNKDKDGLVRVSVEDPSAARAAELANGYVQELQHLSGSLAVGEASQRRLFLEKQLEQSKNKLADAEESLKQTEQRTGVIQVESQARALIEMAASLRAQIAAREVQIGSMQSYSGAGNVDLIAAQRELSELRAQLAKLNGSSDDQVNGLSQAKGQITSSGLEYLRRLREVKYQEALFEILARQYEAARLDEAKEGSIIQVVDPAKVPDFRSGPKRSIILGVCLIIGFFGGVGYLIARSSIRNLQKNPEHEKFRASLKQIFRA
jgi:uncharacterized protein involved in exopolysaccharide biosynthesis